MTMTGLNIVIPDIQKEQVIRLPHPEFLGLECYKHLLFVNNNYTVNTLQLHPMIKVRYSQLGHAGRGLAHMALLDQDVLL